MSTSPSSASSTSSLSDYTEGPLCSGAMRAAFHGDVEGESEVQEVGDEEEEEEDAAGPSEIRGSLRTLPASETVDTGNDNGQVQAWPEFLMEEERVGERDNEPGPSTGHRPPDVSSSVAGRKRRITANEQDAASHERGQSRTRHESTTSSSSRPDRSRQLSWRDDESAATAHDSSRDDSAVNVTGSLHSASRQLNSLRHRESSFTDYRVPRWQPDSEVSQCPICGTTFTFWYRKHHCRKCGRVVCSACSPHRITIPRQFIVQPSEAQHPLSTIVQSNPSVPQVTDLSGNERDGTRGFLESSDIRQRSQTQTYGSLSNPALGGGEVVRLCNPCVPDPNPEPPRRYGTINELMGESGSAWRGDEGAQERDNQYSSLRRPSHRPSASVPSHLFQDEPRGSQRTGRHGGRGRGLPSFWGSLGHSDTSGFNSSPSYISPTGSRRQQGYASPRSSSSGQQHSANNRHNRRTNTSYNHSRPLPPPPMGDSYRHVDEEDLCPVCNLLMPSPTVDGGEEARERHLRECLERLGLHTQAGSGGDRRVPPETPVGMLHFEATEKDCVGRDGATQECTICMEEYEVGAQLTRLECLCKFHKTCIVDWFQRKQECPVHKVA